jgi:hypothetical protein
VLAREISARRRRTYFCRKEAAHTQPEVLAHHYTKAGLVVEAIRHWQRAGERALERFANLEAINHLAKRAWPCSKRFPRAPSARHELGLQLRSPGR